MLRHLSVLRVLLAMNGALALGLVAARPSDAGAQVQYPPCCKSSTSGEAHCCTNCCILNPPGCETNEDCKVHVE